MNSGDTLQGYELIEPIAEGGMGTVWKAKHPNLDRLVAIKCIRADLLLEPNARGLFVEEVKHLSQLHSPQVVQVIDSGVSINNEPFMVTEYLNGEDLSEHLDSNGAVAPAEACRIGIQVLRALTEAHALGIIHGDLKPSNVFLMSVPGEKRPVVKVLDFGVASLVEENHTEHDTLGSREVRGSLQYMAPEQLTRSKITTASDLYTFGAMMYRLLTNRHVFQGTSDEQIRLKLTETPVPPSSVSTLSEIPKHLDDLVLSCLHRLPEERPSSASALRRRLEMISSKLEAHDENTKSTTAVDSSIPDWLESGFTAPNNAASLEAPNDKTTRSTLPSARPIELSRPSEFIETLSDDSPPPQALLESDDIRDLFSEPAIELDVSRTVEQAAPAIGPSGHAYGSDNYATRSGFSAPDNGKGVNASTRNRRGGKRALIIASVLGISLVGWYLATDGVWYKGVFQSKTERTTQVKKRKSVSQQLEEGEAFLRSLQQDNDKKLSRKRPGPSLNSEKLVIILPSSQRAHFVNASTGRKICPTAVQSCAVPRKAGITVRAPGFQPIRLGAKRLSAHQKTTLNVRLIPIPARKKK